MFCCLIAQHGEHERYHRFGHFVKSVGKQAIHSTLNTNVITSLDTCQLHVPQQCIAIHFEHERYFFFLAPSSLQGLGFGLLYWAVSRQRRNCRTGQSPGLFRYILYMSKAVITYGSKCYAMICFHTSFTHV